MIIIMNGYKRKIFRIKFILGEILLLLVLLILLQSCRKDDTVRSSQEVQFTARVSAIVPLETGMPVDQRQQIGVFMKRGASRLQEDNILSGIYNRRYITDGNGVFRSEDLSVRYPTNQMADVIAYLPYHRQLDGFNYVIDINDQTNQAALDFMHSNNLRGVAAAQRLPELVFERQMAKVEINVSGQRDVSLQGVQVVLQGMRTTGLYNLQAESLSSASNSIRDVQALVTARSAVNSLAEVTIFPQTTGNAQRFVFTLQNGVRYSWELPTDTIYQSGHRYVYDIVLGGDSENVEPVAPPQVYFETPQLVQNGQRTQYITHMMPDNAALRPLLSVNYEAG